MKILFYILRCLLRAVVYLSFGAVWLWLAVVLCIGFGQLLYILFWADIISAVNWLGSLTHNEDLKSILLYLFVFINIIIFWSSPRDYFRCLFYYPMNFKSWVNGDSLGGQSNEEAH